MTTTHQERIRFSEKKGENIVYRLYSALRHSCMVQGFIVALSIPFIVMAADGFNVLPTMEEDNPDHLGGHKCEVKDVRAAHYDLLSGISVEGEQMPSEYRMLDGKLIAFENGNQTETYEVYLPAGRFNFAMRFKGKPGGHIIMWVENEAIDFQQRFRKSSFEFRWYVRQYAFVTPAAGNYTITIESVNTSQWCTEIVWDEDQAP